MLNRAHLRNLRAATACFAALAASAANSHAQAVPPFASLTQEAYVKASNPDAEDLFGSSIDVDGDTLVIGSIWEASNAAGANGNQNDNSLLYSGAAYVFVHDGNQWSQQAYLKASNPGHAGQFGASVAIDGDTLVVGAIGESSDSPGVNGNQFNNLESMSGAAYVFVRQGTVWTQQAYLKSPDPDAGDKFGTRCDIDGDTIVVTSTYERSNATGVNGDFTNNDAPGAGAAYVFVRNGTDWSYQAYLKASNTEGGDWFGGDVSISGDRIFVGARFEDSSATGINGDELNNDLQQSGAVYIFSRTGTNWSQEAFVKPQFPDSQDSFGVTLASDGDRLVVGASGESSTAANVGGDESNNHRLGSGAAYVFSRIGSTWEQTAYLKAFTPETRDGFGGRVAIDGDFIAVGTSGEDSSATGIDGDETDNSAEDSGAVYTFAFTGTTWTPQSYVKASNPEFRDRFGSNLALSSDLLVVRANGEDSNASGINGDQSNNDLSNSGAAYVFRRIPFFQNLCNGDGGNQAGCTDCPCMNNAPPGSIGGCVHSGARSTRLLASGSNSVSLPSDSDSDLRFEIRFAPSFAFGVLNSNDAVGPLNMANPCFGLNTGTQSADRDGLRCVFGASLQRHGGRSADATGRVGITTDGWGGEFAPASGIAGQGGFAAGQTRFFQFTHRDDVNSGCMRGLNTSQAVGLTYTP